MNKVQAAYIQAKAQYETITALVSAETAPIYEQWDNGTMDDDTASNLIEDICEKHGQYSAYDALKVAEDALINWSYSKIEKLPEYAQNLSDLEAVRAATQTRITIRRKVIGLAMRLA